MTYSMDTLRQLREATGAGIVDVKAALEEAGGDPGRATEILRKKGKSVAQKKADRVTREGVIGTYVHSNHKIAGMVALACETDFVARNGEFRQLAHDLALHVVAAQPRFLRPSDVPAQEIEKERDIARAQLAGQKANAVLEKILEGKLQKFYSEQCLLEQPFVKDDTMTIGEVVEAAIAKMGEKIEIRQFVRLHL